MNQQRHWTNLHLTPKPVAQRFIRITSEEGVFSNKLRLSNPILVEYGDHTTGRKAGYVSL